MSRSDLSRSTSRPRGRWNRRRRKYPVQIFLSERLPDERQGGHRAAGGEQVRQDRRAEEEPCLWAIGPHPSRKGRTIADAHPIDIDDGIVERLGGCGPDRGTAMLRFRDAESPRLQVFQENVTSRRVAFDNENRRAQGSRITRIHQNTPQFADAASHSRALYVWKRMSVHQGPTAFRNVLSFFARDTLDCGPSDSPAKCAADPFLARA